jgi:S-DNA-T family DNA segregation ATPase FtsK/SpoIIIE
MIEALLGLPPSAVQYHPPREPVLKRLADGAVEGLLAYKSLLLTPLATAAVQGAATLTHYAPHHDLVGGISLGVSALAAAGAAIASLAHITNETSPHQIATQRAGHVGKILATAFGVFVFALDYGVATLAGPFSGTSWGAAVLATLGFGGAFASWIHDNRVDAYVRQTHRIGEAAQLAEAVRTVLPFPPGPPLDGGNAHPLSQQVLVMLAGKGVRGASIDGMPAITSARQWALTVNHPGTEPRRIIARADEFASALLLGRGALRITKGEGAHQTIWTVNNIPMADLEPPGAHPVLEAPKVSIWDPVSLGLDDEGKPVEVVLAGTPGILIGANPRMGKSNVQAALACAAVRADDARLWTLDASERELTIFEEVSDRHVGADIKRANRVLAELQAEITERGQLLKDARVTELTREVAHKLGLDCIGLHVDELSYFTDYDVKKLAEEFRTRLRDIASRGGACGVYLVLAAQKPEADVVPSSVRDMISIKLALYCETPEQVDTILGRGMHRSLPAHELTVSDKGVGYIKGLPDRAPCRLRTHKVSVEERYAVVDAAAPHFTPTPPRGPDGGGEDEPEDDEPGEYYDGLRIVPTYPDGEQVGENYARLWMALDRFGEQGFTRNEVGALATELRLLNGRSGVQRPIDNWARSGYLVKIGTREGAPGVSPIVWRKVTAEEYRAGQRAAS